MICLVTTRSHRYTHKRLLQWDGPNFAIWSYDRVLSARSLPAATWIFTDFDRLGFWELELAARLWRQLKAAGLRVLNDPARVLQRFPLLRALKRAGMSCFDVWQVESDERPDATAFPVFLRNDAAHRGPIGDLIGDPAALDERIAEALAAGYPRRDLIIVQYAAEPVLPGLFRKMSAFKIGDRMVPALCVHEADWRTKQGTVGIATPALYEEERDIVVDNRYGERLAPAFALAEIDYGRADFALPHGQLAVYEINSNPAISGSRADHPSQFRREAFELWRKQYLSALAEIDTPVGAAAIRIVGDPFDKQRRRDWPVVRSRWMP
jgi:hypothetical protein